MTRPSITPDLVADLSQNAPGRLIGKLDKDPTLAERWEWRADGESWTVDTGKEQVTLTPDKGTVVATEEIACTCLLAPKCLHILAVVTRLPVVETTAEKPAGPQEERLSDEHQRGGLNCPAENQLRAAEQVAQVAARLLTIGAVGCGASLQGELLRAVHQCRALGLHRLAAGGVRTISGVRALREGAAEFSLTGLSETLYDLIFTARMLSRGEPIESRWFGTARRKYTEVGNLRLFGLFTEPVVASSGYSGVTTYLTDRQRRLYTVSDVLPGEPERARSAYSGGVAIGEVSISHRQLCRKGVFLQSATLSEDHRLGSGQAVGAVAAEGGAWWDEPLSDLFAQPLDEQLDRCWHWLEHPSGERPAGSDLVFTEVQIEGAANDALIATDNNGLQLELITPSPSPVLAYRDNLIRLGAATDTPVLIIGRVLPGRPKTVGLLACGQTERDQPGFYLEARFNGRINLGLDVLQGNQLPSPKSAPRFKPMPGDAGAPKGSGNPDRSDPLEPLRRRLERLVLGGRATLPVSGATAVEREAALLTRRMMPTGAQLLRQLQAAASVRERDVRGAAKRSDPSPLVNAWLEAGAYERAATSKLFRIQWASRDTGG